MTGLPWWSSGEDSAFSLQGAPVRSLVGELGSHVPLGAAKTEKKKKKCKYKLEKIFVNTLQEKGKYNSHTKSSYKSMRKKSL